MKEEALTPGERFIFNWQYGLETSSFKNTLILLMTASDDRNLEKLSLGWPDEVNALISYRKTPGWWDRVRGIGENAHR
jgi:hypothetical protein